MVHFARKISATKTVSCVVFHPIIIISFLCKQKSGKRGGGKDQTSRTLSIMSSNLSGNNFCAVSPSLKHLNGASAQNLFSIVFERDQNLFLKVLPYCFLNCTLLALVAWWEVLGDTTINISATGHGLMAMLVSFLVISKVNLAYERWRTARHVVGTALLRLRELHQLILTLSSRDEKLFHHDNNSTKSKDGVQGDLREQHAIVWTNACTNKIVALVEATRHVLKSAEWARHLARDTVKPTDNLVDPMELVHELKWHLHFQSMRCRIPMVVLERLALQRKLGEYVNAYDQVLELASTPLPFLLVQMGRVFLFLWIFSMPLVLRHGPFADFVSALLFLFFLTYGFIGLELLSMQLAAPFGKGADREDNDLINVHALCDATVSGIYRDLANHAKLVAASGTDVLLASLQDTTTISQRRRQFADLKSQQTTKSDEGKDRVLVPLGWMRKTAEDDEGGRDDYYAMTQDSGMDLDV